MPVADRSVAVTARRRPVLIRSALCARAGPREGGAGLRPGPVGVHVRPCGGPQGQGAGRGGQMGGFEGGVSRLVIYLGLVGRVGPMG